MTATDPSLRAVAMLEIKIVYHHDGLASIEPTTILLLGKHPLIPRTAPFIIMHRPLHTTRLLEADIFYKPCPREIETGAQFHCDIKNTRRLKWEEYLGPDVDPGGRGRDRVRHVLSQ